MKFSLTKRFQHLSFPLVELLIVASIIIVLSIIVLANYEFGGYQQSLQESAHKVAQDIRKAEKMAMFVKEFEGSIPLGGYGMNFDLSNPTSYILFADNGNHIYDPGDKIVEEIDLGDEIRINELQGGEEKIKGVLPLDIVFTPPDPVVSVNSDKNFGVITLWSEKTNGTTAVYVNSVGLVEIE